MSRGSILKTGAAAAALLLLGPWSHPARAGDSTCPAMESSPPAGKELYCYDALGRLIQVSYADGSLVSYRYDAAGNRTQLNVTNRPPVAVADSATTPASTAVTVSVLANDTDADGDTLTVTAASTPGHGSRTINSATTITYTPTGGYNGTDSFTYTISDGHGGSSTATVSLTVGTVTNHNPVATADSKTTLMNTALTFDPRTNDTDADGDTLAITGAGSASHGTVSVNSGTSLTYTPTTSYYGTDSFTYSLSDGHGGTATGTVTMTVNRAPVATADTASVAQNTAQTVSVLGNDSDPDGDTLSVSAVTNGAHGTVTTNGTTVTYTPATGYTGSDSFTYTLSDGRGGTATGTVSVTVSASSTVTAVNDTLTINQNFDDGTSITPSGYKDPRTNDSSSGSYSLSITGVTQGSNGGVVTYTSTGVTYTYPYAVSDSMTDTDTFTYTVSDGHGGSATATVTVNITATRYCNGTACIGG